MSAVRSVALCLALTVAGSLTASAQAPSSTVRGVVRDPGGAGVPSATVSIVVGNTGLTRHATTDADGAFVVPGLPPGKIAVVVTAPGFAEARRSDVVVEVGQTAALVIELPVEQVKETVVVGGGVDVVGVDTSRSVVDAVIPRVVDRRVAPQRPELSRAGVSRARQRARAELRSHEGEQRARCRRPASSDAAATSRSTAPTTTTTSWAGRCRT